MDRKAKMNADWKTIKRQKDDDNDDDDDDEEFNLKMKLLDSVALVTDCIVSFLFVSFSFSLSLSFSLMVSV